MAYDVVTGQTDKLTAALAKTSGKDIVQFAKAVEISSPTIDGKVCAGSHAALPGSKSAAVDYSSDWSSDSSTRTAQCSGFKTGSPDADKRRLSKFVSLTRVGDGTHWPTGQGGKSSSGPEIGAPNSNAIAMAKDLVEQLSSEEKTIVAGLLAKTIEGGEVVEIRAVSSTSVMVNACYDLLSEGLGVVPYACVGLGRNFVGVVDGTRRTTRL
ncbi:Major surface antigen 4 precursor [Anaplasma phagocytophilum]|nr:Major surface antigen 4 precursor [Anaplasma phagocytophilum]SCV65957.1 Major surface antigen 4 precursor [Anaplasma phagocytophilum]